MAFSLQSSRLPLNAPVVPQQVFTVPQANPTPNVVSPEVLPASGDTFSLQVPKQAVMPTKEQNLERAIAKQRDRYSDNDLWYLHFDGDLNTLSENIRPYVFGMNDIGSKDLAEAEVAHVQGNIQRFKSLLRESELIQQLPDTPEKLDLLEHVNDQLDSYKGRLKNMLDRYPLQQMLSQREAYTEAVHEEDRNRQLIPKNQQQPQEQT